MSAPITLTGRLGADPEVKFSQAGKAIANLRVVTDRRTKSDGGDWTSVDVTWWRVSAFGATAENVAETLSKGDAVIIVGTVKGREWEDVKTGEKRTAIEVTANHIGADLSKVKSAPKVQASTDDPWATTPVQSSEIPF